MTDEGEDSSTSAQRELREETGYTGGTWTYLGAVELNLAIHNHLCHHWLATDAELTDKMDLDEGEDIELVFMREEEIVDAVRRGEIRHALALSVLSRVFDLWPRPFAFKPSEFKILAEAAGCCASQKASTSCVLGQEVLQHRIKQRRLFEVGKVSCARNDGELCVG